MDETHGYDLFVSYADADRAWVEGYLLDALVQSGVRCYSEAAFALGAPRLLEFERAIKQSQRTLLVLSPAYLAEGSGQFTDLLAQSYGLETSTWPVIPLILHPVQLPPRLAMLTALDATDENQWPAVVSRLLDNLKRPTPGPAAKPPCPYPGMVPFNEADSERFFGRDAEIGQVVEMLRLHPFLTVIGPSGTGKSSLVFAGVIPALRKSGLFGAGEWLVRTLRPGETPLSGLGTALGGDASDPARTVSKLFAASPNAGRLLLVVDQFEELFTVTRQDGVPFQEALLQLSKTPQCYIIVTARADFYPDLMALPLWPEIQAHRFEVLPLGERELRQAIVRPAEDVGVYVEGALVERLVADAAAEPGVLPLVQETLVLLWEHVERRFLPLSAYEALVLPRSAYGTAQGQQRTGLQVAIARRADATLAAMTPEQQALARRIFLRLIQFGEGRADTRRQQSLADLRSVGEDPALFDRTLQQLTDSRMLTVSGAEGEAGQAVDIAHEALITGWPTLQKWLVERRAAEQTRRRLEDKAAEWVRLGRGAGGLLDQVELREAENWLNSPDAADLGYDESLVLLVKASRAELKQEAERERRALRFRLGALGAIALLVIVVLGIGYLSSQQLALSSQQLARQESNAAATAEAFAAGQATLAAKESNARATAQAARATAEAEQQVSRAHELAANAIAALQVDPEFSLLLAMQGVQALHSEQTDDALRQSLLESHIRLLLRGEQEVYAAAFSPDGKQIAMASSDGTVRLWDAATGSTTLVLSGHTDAVHSVAFSPDGSQIVTASSDKTARIWEAATGRVLLVLRGHTATVNTAVFSPDGKQIVTTSGDKTARIWEAATGRELSVFRGHSDIVNSAVFSPDGKQVVSASKDQTALIWEVAAGRKLQVLRGHQASVNYAAFSPDGKQIVTASSDSTARIWNAANGVQLDVLLGHTDAVHSATFSPDGKQIATASSDRTARIWEVATGREPIILRGHTGPIYSAFFNNDGTSLVTASLDGTARIWDNQPGHEVAVLQAHAGEVSGVAFSPDGKEIVTTHSDGTVHLWSTGTWKEITLFTGHTDAVNSAAFSPDGKWIVTASGDRTARVWDAATGRSLTVLKGHRDAVNSAAFSPDGKEIATASGDGTARIWNAATGAQLTVLRGHTGAVHSVAYSPDGKQIVTAGDDGTARIWNAATGDPLRVLRGHINAVYSAAFSPDGKQVVTGSQDKSVRLWDAGTGLELAALRRHTDTVYSAVYSPDGTQIVTASSDYTVRLWDVVSQSSTAVLRGHTDAVLGAVFSPDGRQIVTASSDGTTRVYFARIDDLLALARSRVTRGLTCVERQTFLYEQLDCPTPVP